MSMEIRELPPLERHPKVVIDEFGMVVIAHGRSPGRITSFDTILPPPPWWKCWWWRVCGLWPIYRCRHDR